MHYSSNTEENRKYFTKIEEKIVVFMVSVASFKMLTTSGTLQNSTKIMGTSQFVMTDDSGFWW
jgi:hypothetical protein